ncbi:hypothetical protein [Paenibacillus sp. DMB20]|uniref:hypothetical protein n=1 Tax=Paenibacillus sp. DMB20 TaxID=1642570 RepID=UPI000A7E1C81|nr:hypothetical protein [Paenibacillus sp. DMB20]
MKLNLRRRMAALLSVALIISSVTLGTPAAVAGDPDTGGQGSPSAAAADPVTLVSQDEHTVLEFTDINPGEEALSQKSGYLALFTHGARVTADVYDNDVLIREQTVALVVDAAGVVQKKHGPDGDPPNAWDTEENAAIPEGGYIVLAGDGSWDDSGYRKPLFLHYEAGDRIKLKRGGVEVTAADFLTQTPGPNPDPEPEPEPGEKPELVLNTPPDTTVTIPLVEVSGYVKNYMEDKAMRVTVNDKEAPLTASGSFKLNVYLHPGPNAVTVRLWEGEAEQASVTLNAVYDTAGQIEDYIEVEAAPADITIGIEGPRKKLDFIDKDVTGIENIIALYTRDYGPSLLVPKYNVAVLVDGNNRVVQVVNPSVGGKPPVWTGPTELTIPEDGYVLMAQDNSYAGNDIKRFLAEKFKVGDMIKLRKNGEVVAIRDLRSGFIARLKLENPPMYTVTDSQTDIKGMIENIDDPSAIELTVNDAEVPFAPDGSFSYSYPLQTGTNYVDVKVLKRGKEQDARSLAIFNRPGFSTQKDVILWVDQAANARKFQTSDHVRDFLEQAKKSGSHLHRARRQGSGRLRLLQKERFDRTSVRERDQSAAKSRSQSRSGSAAGIHYARPLAGSKNPCGDQ